MTLETIKQGLEKASEIYSAIDEAYQFVLDKKKDIETLTAENDEHPDFKKGMQLKEAKTDLLLAESYLVTTARNKQIEIKRSLPTNEVSYYLHNSIQTDTELNKRKEAIQSLIAQLKDEIKSYNEIEDERKAHYIDEVRQTGFSEFVKKANTNPYWGMGLSDPTDYFMAEAGNKLYCPHQLDEIIK